MADNDVYLVPSLVTYEDMERRGTEVGLTEVGAAKDPEVLEAGRNAVALARDAGSGLGSEQTSWVNWRMSNWPDSACSVKCLACTAPFGRQHQPTPPCFDAVTLDASPEGLRGLG